MGGKGIELQQEVEKVAQNRSFCLSWACVVYVKVRPVYSGGEKVGKLCDRGELDTTSTSGWCSPMPKSRSLKLCQLHLVFPLEIGSLKPFLGDSVYYIFKCIHQNVPRLLSYDKNKEKFLCWTIIATILK